MNYTKGAGFRVLEPNAAFGSYRALFRAEASRLNRFDNWWKELGHCR